MNLNYREIRSTERSDKKLRGQNYTTVQVPSESNPSKFYTVDVTNARCSCPGWTRHFPRKPCKHMRALGVMESAQQ